LAAEGLLRAGQHGDSAQPADLTGQVLRALVKGPLNHSYLKRKLPGSASVIETLRKKGWLALDEVVEDRKSVRAGNAALNVTPVTADPRPPRRLTSAQRTAVDTISASVAGRQFRTFLLHGVTGSGKTEVYLRSIDKVLREGKSCLFLVPEISLTPAAASEFHARFGEQVAILHTAFTDPERPGQWRRVREGKARVVVGTRSSVFAPLEEAVEARNLVTDDVGGAQLQLGALVREPLEDRKGNVDLVDDAAGRKQLDAVRFPADDRAPHAADHGAASDPARAPRERPGSGPVKA
jgi:primosomal protein N'